MDEPHNDPPEIPPPPPLPGGFKADEVTSDELREMRAAYIGYGTQNGIKSEWPGLQKAFGQLMIQNAEQQGQFRDEAAKDRVAFREEAAKDRRALIQVAARLGEAQQAIGGGMDRIVEGFGTMQTSFVKMQDSIVRLQRVVFGVGVVVVIALGVAVASWVKVDSVERRFETSSEVTHGPRAAAAPTARAAQKAAIASSSVGSAR